MNDNTRINDLQNKLLQAMDIINAKALQSISYDKTIACTIEDDTYREEGKYSVNDGSRIFIAYTNDTRLKNKDTVYVTIPQGNYDNQKIIIGKRTVETEKPYTFVEPFDFLFDMTDNIVKKANNGALIANALNKYGQEKEYEYITLYDEPCNYYGFTRLGLKANFKSWVKSAIRGTYGLVVVLTTSNTNLASTQEVIPQEFYYTFSNKDFYGNSYEFETDYEQQIVIPLEEVQGTITNIKINFYQEANFFDRFNEPIPCSIGGYLTEENTNIYIKDEDGNFVIDASDTLLEPNLLVKDIFLCLGYDISVFTKDMVEIYTQQSNTYRHSEKVGDDGQEKNKKEIKVRWVHVDENGPKDMVTTEKEQIEKNYEVRWYRYKIGASAADPYCGTYWTRIEGVNGFSYIFNPDIELQQEKIKVVVLYNSTVPYHSNVLLFDNEEDLPPSAEAYHIENALTIIADDGTNGNYMVYGQDNSIKDTAYSKEVRSLSVVFDGNSNGQIDSQETIGEVEKENVLWTFPATNTMIELLNENKEAIVEHGREGESVLGYSLISHAPIYKISSYYSPSKSNNTITCQYTLNGRIYKTEKELTFGRAGTMGSEQTLVIDFLNDDNAVNKMLETNDEKNPINNAVSIQIQLYNNQNVSEVIPPGSVQWAWYYNSQLEAEWKNSQNTQSNEINVLQAQEFPYIINKEGDSVITFDNSDFDINHLYILQGTVGNLTTYFPISIQQGGYSYIEGPTQVIYQSNGEPTYSREPYSLYTDREGPDEIVKWKIIHHIDNDDKKEQKEKFIGQLSDTNKLQPLSIYTKDAPVYGVQAYTIMEVEKEQEGETAIETVEYPLWTQPILVLQNLWPNSVINAWDGKSLVLDEDNSTIIAASIAAGKKNSEDNTFSGVMIGDWKGKDAEDSITEQTGIYGFYHGAMSYAFKEDGTAFIGKSSMARINFDGSNATIYSSGYNTTSGGMMINLYNNGEPYISLKSRGDSDSDDYSEMRFDTKTSGSTIKLKRKEIEINGEKYTGGDIIISNENTLTPLKIGSDFSVSWQGGIKANSGTIGSWKINHPDNGGALQSDDGKIVLSTEGTGTIKINNTDIVIRGSYYDTKEKKQMRTQMTLSSDSIIHGGIIEAGTLRSNSDSSFIALEGYITVGEGSFGYVKSNAPEATDPDGIGILYNKNQSRIVATGTNAGIAFGNASIAVYSGKIGMAIENYSGGFGLYSYAQKPSGLNGAVSGKNVLYTDVPASNQFGIYARFA